MLTRQTVALISAFQIITRGAVAAWHRLTLVDIDLAEDPSEA